MQIEAAKVSVSRASSADHGCLRVGPEAQHALAGARPRSNSPDDGRTLQRCQRGRVDKQRIGILVVKRHVQVDAAMAPKPVQTSRRLLALHRSQRSRTRCAR
jgi:hypothetical protein